MLAIGGCSSDSPSGPDSVVGDLFIGGIYHYYPGGPPSRGVNGALVMVKDGAHDGPVVSGLTVKINGQELAFQQSTGYYTGVAPTVTSGENVTLSVSDGLGTLSRTAQVPYCPSDLALNNGAWDTSSSFATNTLTWDNPVSYGQSVGVYIYDDVGGDLESVFSGFNNDATADAITLYNWQLDYYDLTSVICMVGQVNYVYFEDNPDDSAVVVITGLWGGWPVVY